MNGVDHLADVGQLKSLDARIQGQNLVVDDRVNPMSLMLLAA
jgi:hypothetical protein